MGSNSEDKCKEIDGESCPIDLHFEMLKCKELVFERVRDLDHDIQSVQARIDNLESIMSSRFSKSDAERKAMNDEIMKHLDTLTAWFQKHDEKEMSKYDEIIRALQDVVDDTKHNTKYISEKEANEQTEAEVQRRLKEANAPREEIMHKIKMTAIGVITTALVSGSITGIWFVVDLYQKMNG